MGSGSSSQPKETQSAPATARATPKQAPKRNRQFEEVQIAGQGGNTPRSRQQQQGTSPRPPNQAAAKTPRGQDPGASGSTSDRTSRQQPPQANRQGAAANGRNKSQPKSTNMPAQQPPGKNNPGTSVNNRQPNQVNAGLGRSQQRSQNKTLGTITETEAQPGYKAQVNAGLGGSQQRSQNKTLGTITETEAQPGYKTQVNAGLGGSQQRSQNKSLSTITETEAQTGYKTKHGSAAGAKANVDKRSMHVKTETGEINGKKTGEMKTNAKPGKAVADNNASASNESGKEVNAGASNGTGPTQDAQGKSRSNKTPASNRMEDDLSIDDDDNISYDQGEPLRNSTEEDWDNIGQSNNPSTSETPAAQNQIVEMKDDDLVFETFYHRSGKEFQCIYQSGMRFYLDDWGSKEWQPFPKRWYNEGLLVTNTILKDDNAEQGRADQNGAAAGQGQSTSRSQGRSQGNSGGGGGGGGGNDDREGFLMHPTKGRVPTYIFYKKHNVHMYFDRDTGSWVRMPIGWELNHHMVKSLVDQVEEAVPTWGDRHDILSLLRACNYDPDECINIYLHLQGDEWMKAPKTSKDNKILMEKEARILDLEKRVKHLEAQLQKEITTREEAERNLETQMNKFSELEAESKETEAHLSAVTGGRPVSARPFSRMVKGGQKPGAKGAKGAAVGMAAAGKTPQAIGEVVNPDDILDLNANAKELRKAHTRVKMDVERYMGDLKVMMEKFAPAVKQLKQSEKGTQNEIEEVRALYRKEALQRRLLYNQLQELRGNIRVFCRVRKDDRAESCYKFPSDQDLVITHPQQGKKIFSFDKVFEPNSTQEAVFEDTKPIITSCVDGYNVCLLAYGQTGSGKTFTMMGPENNPGINIRAMKELFNVCAERTETMEYSLKVSLVEIYNETIQDLLTNDVKTLELRTAGNKVQIPGLIEHPIKTIDDVKKIMAMGDKNRSVASTKMNSTSSRSHLVLMLNVEGKDKVTGAISRGSLVLCDLAGSERISKTEAEGQRLVEAAAINKSLSALGQVFTALRSSQLHVPYRNSKLTQILQPSLGGDAKACLFVNTSPDSYNFSESVSTLTFGSNARQVTLGQAKQNITKGK